MNSKISHIIDELKEVQQILEKSGQSEGIPRIEFDITIFKLQQIYDAILHLQLPLVNDSRNEETPIPANEPKNNIGEHNKDSKVVNNDLMQLDDQMQEEIAEHKTEKGQAPDTKHIEEIQHQQDAHQGKEILAEKYRKNQKYINELLAQGYHKQDISSLMQSKPLKNIEAAIGINEKFLFTRELFSNDEETFLKTIRILNNSSNFNEAFNYIHSTFNWNIEGEAAQKLLDLVRRRFIVEED